LQTKKGDEFYCLENGNIVYKNKEYEFGYDYVLQNRYYDELSPTDVEKRGNWSSEDIWIKIDNGELLIYRIEVPEDYDMGDWKTIGEYFITDTLKEIL
jgi:hypothetical protein